MNKIKKILSVLEGKVINKFNYFSADYYMKKKRKYLKKVGLRINDKIGYVDPSVHFDGTDYTLISIGEETTISKDVLFLTHDFSINRGLRAQGYSERGKFIKPIEVGKNCFIGARTTLLPGTKIGDNVILGANSVVKGNIPDDSIAIGNPAKVVGNIKDWAEYHYSIKDYEVL